MSNVIPYDYKPAKFKDNLSEGYWVNLYCFFDGKHMYYFAHQSEMLENAGFCIECGNDTDTFMRTILVTPRRFSHIFKEIRDYENVSKSGSH